MKKLITQIDSGSIAEELDISIDSYLLSINNTPVTDVFDYKLLMANEYIELLIESNGEQTLYEIEKDPDEDLGLTFETWLMDKPRACANKCIFCFIDQLPPQMRDPLYFKDDDPRLSFISGNYVTLTNISDNELNRIITHRLSPINISVHATNAAVRQKMLCNKNAANLKHQLAMLKISGIEMNFQIVLCKGINDGVILDDTISALSQYMPEAKSLSVVPAGITKFRHTLFPLQPFTSKESAEIIKKIEKHRKLFISKYKTGFVYPSDEFFLTANRPLPAANYYEGFPQLENGVGMMTLFRNEFRKATAKSFSHNNKTSATVATGTLAYPLIKKMLGNYNICVVAIKNNFFGETVSVSGLITGKDLIEQLSGLDLGDQLFIPSNMLKAGEPVFLDNITLTQAEQQLGIKITTVNSGKELAEKTNLYSKGIDK